MASGQHLCRRNLVSVLEDGSGETGSNCPPGEENPGWVSFFCFNGNSMPAEWRMS